ncbi:MAG: PadR family transcriptional regulator [Rhizobiales bacterium]|nr:PadR family transcriptional regulator [Hyphomicrobiales bacterium]
MFAKMKRRHGHRHGRHSWHHDLDGLEGGRPRRHGPHGRRRRLFDQGDLRFIILGLIAQKPRHGYEVIKDLEESFNGAYSPSPGVIYPTLTLLEDMGLATVEAVEGNKKRYSITAEGSAYLAEHKATIADVEARLKEARESFGTGPAPEVVRAIQNMRLALDQRLQRPANREASLKMAQAIDAATAAIEQS